MRKNLSIISSFQHKFEVYNYTQIWDISAIKRSTNKFKESFNLAITSYLYIFSKYSGRYFRLNIIFSKLQITKNKRTSYVLQKLNQQTHVEIQLRKALICKTTSCPKEKCLKEVSSSRFNFLLASYSMQRPKF